MFDSVFGDHGIQDIKTVVFQPRRANVDTEHITAQELLCWAEETVKPAAKLAWDGAGEQRAGTWCQFCGIKAECRTRAEANMALAAYDFREPFLLENDEIAAILDKSELFKNWIKDVESFALTEALKGVKFPGYKVVEGRSNRRYTDESAIINTLRREAAATDEDIFKKELRGITELERKYGRKRFNEMLGAYIGKPQGKPALVPETDNRQEIDLNTAARDFEEPAADQTEE
jgi:hypothetical protein